MTKPEKQLVLGALDSLAVTLAKHGHEWTDGERAVYEEALKVIGVEPTQEEHE